MKFSLFRDYGAQNSKPVFDAFADSLSSNGHVVVDNTYDCDVGVIWSVLWNGRMAPNKKVWDDFHAHNKKIIVLEVGGLIRGTTWKVGVGGINREAYFGPKGNDNSRAKQLGLELKPWDNNGDSIVIVGQHERSHQWRNNPSMSSWVSEQIRKIREHTDRDIIWRPHPRFPVTNLEEDFKNVYRQNPVQVQDTYDDFDFSCSGAYAVINHSSNPATHSVINGVPVFDSQASLAYEVGNPNYDTINDPLRPDRTQWLNDIAHTEWTLEEIAGGEPLKHLTSVL